MDRVINRQVFPDFSRMHAALVPSLPSPPPPFSITDSWYLCRSGCKIEGRVRAAGLE